jgi:hypothetical protein
VQHQLVGREWRHEVLHHPEASLRRQDTDAVIVRFVDLRLPNQISACEG